jgi:hypothetical protein
MSGQTQGCIQDHQNNVIIGPRVGTDTRLHTVSPKQRNYRPTCRNRYWWPCIQLCICPDMWTYNYVVLVILYTTLYLFRQVGLYLRCFGDTVYNLVSVPTRGPIITLFWWSCIQPRICQGCIRDHQNKEIIGPHVLTDTRLYTVSPKQRNYRPTCRNRYKAVYRITRTT